ncbi:MAG: MOSC domain-containing protein [Alphaproteobacteria bacterium]|nr:MOSC domain-containing protein [Alphaproteobacteria bacterium]
MTVTIDEIRHYPVKGLNGMTLDRAMLSAGEGLPDDRRFALAHAASQFDRTNPDWLPKRNFLQLMRDERLAQLDARFDSDADAGILTLFRDGRQVARGDITQPLGRALIEQFLQAFIPPGPRGNPHIVEAPGRMLSDVSDKYISIVNLASVKDIERVARAPVDPRRFRANLHLDGLPAWVEMSWPGKEIAIGEARLEVMEITGRCAATEVDPDTGSRDLHMLKILQQGFGHTQCGVYARVVAGGKIEKGDTVTVPPF